MATRLRLRPSTPLAPGQAPAPAGVVLAGILRRGTDTQRPGPAMQACRAGLCCHRNAADARLTRISGTFAEVCGLLERLVDDQDGEQERPAMPCPRRVPPIP